MLLMNSREVIRETGISQQPDNIAIIEGLPFSNRVRRCFLFPGVPIHSMTTSKDFRLFCIDSLSSRFCYDFKLFGSLVNKRYQCFNIDAFINRRAVLQYFFPENRQIVKIAEIIAKLIDLT